jgi:hypothetical protein
MKPHLAPSRTTSASSRFMRHAPRLSLVLLLASLLPGCKSATVTNQRTFDPAPAIKPTLIYVTDFELGAQNIQHEQGVLPSRPGPLGRAESRLYGTSQDPAARARQLVEEMANAIVKDLKKAGFNATRLAPGAPQPTTGWLVRGVFTEVQEGNRLQRAVIGFGSGQTDLQVVTVVDDLSQGPPKPLYEVDTKASSGNKPGAAPVLALNPYAAAARFVMAGQDLDKNVKQTAAQIATQITQRVQPAHPSGP